MTTIRSDAQLMEIAVRKNCTRSQCKQFAENYRRRAKLATGREKRTFAAMAQECERMAELITAA